MDNMFKALPQALQWEVLIEFVGTHVVRGGKLMRKIVLTNVLGNTFRRISDNETIGVPVAELVRERKQLPMLLRESPSRPKYLRLVGSQNKAMAFFRDQYTDETVYLHRLMMNHIMLYEVKYLVPREEDSAVLPLYTRAEYPSYPYTNKKRKIAL